MEVKDSEITKFGIKRDWHQSSEAPRQEKTIFCKTCKKDYTQDEFVEHRKNPIGYRCNFVKKKSDDDSYWKK